MRRFTTMHSRLTAQRDAYHDTVLIARLWRQRGALVALRERVEWQSVAALGLQLHHVTWLQGRNLAALRERGDVQRRALYRLRERAGSV